MSIQNENSADNRRPLQSRAHPLAQKLALYLFNLGLTANQISLASLVFSLLAFLLLWLSFQGDGYVLAVLYVGAALCCQLRLVCNLMDGMVAMLSTQKTPSGAIWNELPDRIADTLIFVGMGLSVGQSALGWAVAAAAILVSYVRELGHGIDGVMDYSGPMAKPHRMACVTVALLLSAMLQLVPILQNTGLTANNLMLVGLMVCGVGCIVTLIVRVSRLNKRLKG